jgi:hypothetical protein
MEDLLGMSFGTGRIVLDFVVRSIVVSQQ